MAGFAASDTAAARKKKLHRALLRFHPDKWSAVLQKVRVEERAALGTHLQGLTRSILKLKEAGERGPP